MNRSAVAPRLLIVLALVGVVVAFYDSYSIYNGQLLWCPPPINGCNEVAASPYARIFNLPVGYYGVVYIFTCWVWRHCSPTILMRAGSRLAQFFTPPWVYCSPCTS